MRRALCYIGLLFAGLLPLAGQSESDGDKPRKSVRSAWFACISSIPKTIDNPVKVMIGTKITELKLSEFMTSDPVKIPADGIIRLVREVGGGGDPAETKYLVQAEAKIPENVREALIILVPLAKPEGDLIFQTKVQDLAAFKGGDRLFINLSTTNIRVRLGETKVIVAAGKATIYESPSLAKPMNMPIMYEFSDLKEKKWKMISASTVVLRPTRREICIFNSGSRPGNIKKHGILFPVQAESP